MLHVSIDDGIVERLLQLGAKVIAEFDLTLAFGFHLVHADLASGAEAHNAGHVERPRTHAALVATAVDLLGDLDAGIATAHIQRSNALGSIDLMSAERKHVDV